MFGDIPKIFDRNFIIAYLLPSSLALAFSLSITHGLGSLSSLDTTRGAVFAAFAFAIGMALMAANRNVTRVLEGYGRINPMRIMKPIQKLRYWYVRRQSLLAKRQRRRHRAGQKPDLNQLRDARIKYMTRLAERYPERKALLMATALGNAIRAFEGYPRVMYNFGVIEGWNRLIAVVPKEFLDLVDSAKAQTDLWINVWLLNILLVLDSFATWYLPASLRPLNSLMSTRQLAFTCVGAVLVISFASTMAASAAV